MRPAATADVFCARHEVTFVDDVDDRVLINRFEEARPSGSRFELCAGVEQREITTFAGESARGFDLQKFSRSRSLGPLESSNLEFERR